VKDAAAKIIDDATRIDPFVSPNMKFETTTDEAIETMCRALGVDVLNGD
jgi:hypothetical protein